MTMRSMPPCFLALGGEAGAGAAADDRLAAGDHGAELFEDVGAGDRHASRSCARRLVRRRAVQRAVGGDGGGGELGVVDVVRHADELARRGLAHGRLQRGEERGVGGRVVEGLARRVERGDAALGQEEADRRVHPVQPLADPAADGGVLLERRAHQGDLRVVAVEQAAAELLGHRLGGAEIDHVDARRPSRHRACGRGSSRRSGPRWRGRCRRPACRRPRWW